MDYKSICDWYTSMAAVFSFDQMPDGTFSEIRIEAMNKAYENHFTSLGLDVPEFYPGIPYRSYFYDINFERTLINAALKDDITYSYVNAHGWWIKGIYIPVSPPESGDSMPASEPENTGKKTFYISYVLKITTSSDIDDMAEAGDDQIPSIVMKMSIILHKDQDFYHSMQQIVTEIKKITGSKRCAIVPVNTETEMCTYINEEGVNKAYLEKIAAGMKLTPYGAVMNWKDCLDGSNCLIVDTLDIIKERDPVWYHSLCDYSIASIILFEIRYNDRFLGFIWATDFEVEKLDFIKKLLEAATFQIGAVIANYQLISHLEMMSTVDALTSVNNRNAMNRRIDQLISGASKLPDSFGIAYADLNGLKTVNDDDGHEAGDKLLIRGAALLKIAFDGYEIYRAGGDEFVVFCPEISETDLDERVSQLRKLTETTNDVSFAVGSILVSGKYDINRAMQEADERMYHDKQEYYRNHPEKDRRKNRRNG